MMAANGRLPDKAPQVTLDGANKRHARISASVEMTTVTKLLAVRHGKHVPQLWQDHCLVDGYSFIPGLHSGKNFGRTEHVEGVRE